MMLGAIASLACAEGHPDYRTTGSPMRFEIEIPPEVRQGEPVPVTLRLSNTSHQPITVYLMGRLTAFDIEVANEAGSIVWRRLAGQTIPAILGVRTLSPGEALTFEGSWPQRDQSGRPVPAGIYTLTGVLPTDAEPLRTAARRLHVVSTS